MQRLVEIGAWKSAEELWRGPILDGFRFERPEFEEWLDKSRLQYSSAAARIVEGLVAEGRIADAETFAGRLGLEWDGTGASTGYFPKARGLKVTQRPEDSFVGRVHELKELERLRTLCETSGFTSVLLEGEPGIGKTALVSRFGRLREMRGDAVLAAKGILPEQNVPFGVVVQWIREIDRRDRLNLSRPWLQILSDAFPGLFLEVAGAIREDQVGEYRLLEALRRLFLDVAGTRPLVLVLDDANLADSTSLSFCHYMSRRSPNALALFIATIRHPSVLGGDPLSDWSNVNRISLAPFSLAETEALVRRITDDPLKHPEKETLIELSRSSGGNPLLLSTLLVNAGIGAVTDVPDGVASYFRPWLESVSGEANALIAAAAIAGEHVPQGLLGEIAGIDQSQLKTVLVELQSAGLIMIDNADRFRIRHGVASEVALNLLPSVERRALYGRAGRTLAKGGESSPAILAVHHDIGGDRQRAYETALNAAAASQALYATREREFFLKLALANAPSFAQAAEIRIELAKLYRQIGDPRKGLDVLAVVGLDSAPGKLRSSIRACQLAIELLTVDPTVSPRKSWEEIEELSGDLDPLTTADLYTLLAVASHDLGYTADTVAAAGHALTLIERIELTSKSAMVASRAALIVGLYSNPRDGLKAFETLRPYIDSDIEALCECTPPEATLLVSTGRLMEAERRFLDAIELVERTCRYGSLFSIHNNLGVCYIEQGKYHDAKQHLEEAARAGAELSAPSDAAIASDNLSFLYFEQGRFEKCIRIARESLATGEARSSRALFTRHGLIGLCSLELGLLAQAYEAKREIDLLLTQHEYWSNDVSYVETFLARMLVLDGKVDAARDRLETAIEVYRERDMMCRSRLELELGRLELKTDPAAALGRAERMLELLKGSGARPLIDRFEELADRARLRSA